MMVVKTEKSITKGWKLYGSKNIYKTSLHWLKAVLCAWQTVSTLNSKFHMYVCVCKTYLILFQPSLPSSWLFLSLSLSLHAHHHSIIFFSACSFISPSASFLLTPKKKFATQKITNDVHDDAGRKKPDLF